MIDTESDDQCIIIQGSSKLLPKINGLSRQINFSNIKPDEVNLFDKMERYCVQPGLQLPKRSYSLQADMVTGWKPRKNLKINLNGVFPINFCQSQIDQVVSELSRGKSKNNKYAIVYLGVRPQNSYAFHEDRPYLNPYPLSKKVQSKNSDRPNIASNFKLPQHNGLKFDSNFQSGNLDLAVEVGAFQYDLFMRVDSNTKGHNNWFNFTIQNREFVGPVRFNICNFRREISLYQRGLRPYAYSQKEGGQWKQIGKDIKYQRKRLRYNFIYDEYEQPQQLCKYFNLSFIYEFEFTMDKVQFAYCIPYTYSQLNTFLGTLKNIKKTQLCRSLAALPIPLIQITDNEVCSENKKVVLVTSRIHPGESNSSYVVEGFLEYICGEEPTALQLRKMYHFYIVPMLNPDGVTAGNYRTSLFGRDLNRTFHQSRKYAFPQTFYLNQFVRELKKKEKQRFCIYLDFHGHSVKKNVFMYGPDYMMNHNYYNASRQLPKILSCLTTLFRYYSCSFKISTEKSSTARATLNRKFKIPFTYTMQASNGGYHDPSLQKYMDFTAEKWKQMGKFTCLALFKLKLTPNPKTSTVMKKTNSGKDVENQNQNQNQNYNENQILPKHEHNSDDDINSGGSDSEPSEEDLAMEQLQFLQEVIGGKKRQQINNSGSESPVSKTHSVIDEFKLQQSSSQILEGKGEKVAAKINFARSFIQSSLPPIITQNRKSFLASRTTQKRKIVKQKLQNISVFDFSHNMDSFQIKNHRVIVAPKKQPVRTKKSIEIQQIQLLLKKKIGKIQFLKKSLKSNR